MPPQAGTLEAKMPSVVKLRVQRPGKSAETASGIYVGKDSQYGYFITALHAVKVNPDPASQDVALLPSVGLQFKTSPQSYEARVLDSFDPSLDLAVVYIPLASLPPSLPQFGVKDATAGTAVHVIGQPAAGEWSVASGTVQNENSPSGDIHHFTTTRDRSLAEGHSGGPVLDDQGNFLGMHSETDPTYGIEAKSADILAQLKAWRVPTDNLTEPVSVEAGPGVSTANPPSEGDTIATISGEGGNLLFELKACSRSRQEVSCRGYVTNRSGKRMRVEFPYGARDGFLEDNLGTVYPLKEFAFGIQGDGQELEPEMTIPFRFLIENANPAANYANVTVTYNSIDVVKNAYVSNGVKAGFRNIAIQHK